MHSKSHPSQIYTLCLLGASNKTENGGVHLHLILKQQRLVRSYWAQKRTEVNLWLSQGCLLLGEWKLTGVALIQERKQSITA